MKQLAASTSKSASAQSSQSAISSALSVTPGTSNSWFFDSGCCNHMTAQSSFFVSKTTPSRTSAIHTADNSKLLVSHTGAISTPSLSLADVLLVPRLTLNLISVGQLCELGFTVTFSDHGCIVRDPQTRKIIGTGRLFEVVFLEVPSLPVACYVATVPQAIWHSKLGHVSISRLRSFIFSAVLGQVDVSQNNCQACQLAKFHALPFNNSDLIAKDPFDLIHSNI